MLSDIHYYSDGRIYYQELYTYDENNKVATHKHEVVNGGGTANYVEEFKDGVKTKETQYLIGSKEVFATIEYDEDGTETRYDKNGNLESIKIINEDGLETETKYDENKNIKYQKVENKDGSTNYTYYNENGNVKSQTTRKADGSRIETSYNEDNTSKTEIKDSKNNTVATIVNNNIASLYPQVNNGCIAFEGDKTIELASGEKAVINADGTVEVTKADGTVVKYNKDGSVIENDQNVENKTNESETTKLKSNAVQILKSILEKIKTLLTYIFNFLNLFDSEDSESNTENNNKQLKEIDANSVSDETTSYETSTTNKNNYVSSYPQIHSDCVEFKGDKTIELASDEKAVINADGTVEVTKADGTVVKYDKYGLVIKEKTDNQNKKYNNIDYKF